MAPTDFQRHVCRLLAANRKAGGESSVARRVTLNELLAGGRVSRDIDLFHDTGEALIATWEADRRLLEADALGVEILRERPGYVEARVRRGRDSVLLQWSRDSAFRFFPLVENADFGLVLHPFDLATNKILALVGRLEVRDWIDLLQCDERLRPLGCLAWAACGKDPAFGPLGILEEAGRSGHYPTEGIEALVFEGPAPDIAALSLHWRSAMADARRVVSLLPVEAAGQAVLTERADLFRGSPDELRRMIDGGQIRFHRGTIRGAWPRLTAE